MEKRLPGVARPPGSAPETEVMTFAWWLVPWPFVLGIRFLRGLKTGYTNCVGAMYFCYSPFPELN